MEIKISEYERKIEILEKKVANLEKKNTGLRDCLLKNVLFSTKLSNIIYEMDCLLVNRRQEIRKLERELKESRVSQLANHEMLIDLGMKAERDDDSPADESFGDFDLQLGTNDVVQLELGESTDGRSVTDH